MATDSFNANSLGEDLFQELNNINTIGEFDMKDDLSDLFESMEKKSRNHVQQSQIAESLAQDSDNFSELGSDVKSTTTSSTVSVTTGKKTRKYERINTDGLSEIEVNDIRKSRK
mmetsp:Transcript_26826/g.30879  ORF Transcript_26826/g.30879 Transcript_26826/m.30879 type:complete len:114 (-) Transcript_26826:1814-2155(-)